VRDHEIDGLLLRRADGARPSREESAPLAPLAPLVELQRAVGNRAVSQLVAGWPGRGLPFTMVQRQNAGGPIMLPPVEITPAGVSLAGIPGATPTGEAAGPPDVPAGMPGVLADKEEESYRTQGEARLGDLGGGAPAASGMTAGHTPVGPIAAFPDWFATLQNALINSTQWRADKEEKAQNLLAEYALKRFAVPFNGDVSKVPPTVRVFSHYIGRSTSNQKAAAKAGLPSSANMGGAEGAEMWCAAAGSSSVRLALESVGLTFDMNAITWLTSPPVPSVGLPKAPTDAPIEPGDQVSYVGGGAPAIGGHTTSAISTSQGAGTEFLHVSGNAGGGTSGSIRFGSSRPRAKPPGKLTFDDFATKSPAAIGAPNDKVWVYAIVQYSKLWEDLGQIDATAPGVWTSGAGAAFCKKYKLKPIPLSA
jgi:hypothetical protein